MIRKALHLLASLNHSLALVDRFQAAVTVLILPMDLSVIERKGIALELTWRKFIKRTSRIKYRKVRGAR